MGTSGKLYYFLMRRITGWLQAIADSQEALWSRHDVRDLDVVYRDRATICFFASVLPGLLCVLSIADRSWGASATVVAVIFGQLFLYGVRAAVLAPFVAKSSSRRLDRLPYGNAQLYSLARCVITDPLHPPVGLTVDHRAIESADEWAKGEGLIR